MLACTSRGKFPASIQGFYPRPAFILIWETDSFLRMDAADNRYDDDAHRRGTAAAFPAEAEGIGMASGPS